MDPNRVHINPTVNPETGAKTSQDGCTEETQHNRFWFLFFISGMEYTPLCFNALFSCLHSLRSLRLSSLDEKMFNSAASEGLLSYFPPFSKTSSHFTNTASDEKHNYKFK